MPLGSAVLSWARILQYNTGWLHCPQHKSNVSVSKQELSIMIRNRGPVECLTSLYYSPQHKSRGPVDCLIKDYQYSNITQDGYTVHNIKAMSVNKNSQ